MATANGAPVSLKEARQQLRLAETSLRLHQTKQALKMLESTSWADDWSCIIQDRLRRYTGEAGWTPASSWNDRRRGAMLPLFSSEQDLNLLRQQSRIEWQINPYAQGLVGGIGGYVRGTGYTYHAEAIDQDLAAACQAVIDAHLARNQWQPDPKADVIEPGLEAELFQRSCVDGEFFLMHWADPKTGQVDVRVVEPEQVTQPPGKGEEWFLGVRSPVDDEGHIDAQKADAYWVQWGTNAAEGEEVEPDRMIHLRRNVVRGVKRGLPDFSFGALDAIRTANKLAHNIAVGAYVQASYAVVRQHATATQAQVLDLQSSLAAFTRTNPTTGRREAWQSHEPGVKDIPEGLNYVLPPSGTNAQPHIDALHSSLRRAGLPWNAPEWLATASGADMAAYTAALTAESPFIRTVKSQQPCYGGAFGRSCWIALQAYCTAKGGLRYVRQERGTDGKPTGKGQEVQLAWEDVRRLVTIQAKAPDPEHHDELQIATRRQIEKLNSVLSVQTWQQQAGYDPETELANQERYLERTGGQGLALPIPTDTAAPGNGPAPVPAPAAK